jgi:hypothetical protein
VRGLGINEHPAKPVAIKTMLVTNFFLLKFFIFIPEKSRLSLAGHHT